MTTELRGHRSRIGRWACPLLASAFVVSGCDSHTGLKKVFDGSLAATGGTLAADAGLGAGGAVGTGGQISDICSSSSQCPAPQVCNFNTDMKCGPAVYTQVDVSELHTCAVVSDGTLRCWGSNAHGQLGVTSTENRLEPASVLGVTKVQRVATGWRHTCVLLWDGQVDCWGYSTNGSLGCATPVLTDVGSACTPYPSGSAVDLIIAGGETACALLADGRVQCWGRNNHYQVGDGTNTTAFQPMTAVGVADATDLATGVWQTCAVIADGTARCWGANNRGELGNGTSNEGPVATAVSGIDGTTGSVLLAAVGEGHTCFVLDDGTVRCTGDDDYGQLGDGGTTRRFAPVVATLLPAKPRLIAVGLGFTCFVGDDLRPQCLGAGSQGQLGNGASAPSKVPVAVNLPEGATIATLAARYNHACAVGTDGRLWCWGLNSSGQLGNGTQITANLPVQVPIPE